MFEDSSPPTIVIVVPLRLTVDAWAAGAAARSASVAMTKWRRQWERWLRWVIANVWSAAACRRFSADSLLSAAAASRGHESGAKAPQSKVR